MKLVHYIGSLSGGGKERRMLETVRGIKNNSDIDQYIIVFNEDTTYDIPIDQDKLFVIFSNNKLRSIYYLYKYLREIRPDCLHVWSEVHFTLLSLIIFKFIFKYRLVSGFIADGNTINDKLVKFVCKLAYLVSDCIISNSKAGLIAKEAPLSKSLVIYNGFSFDRLKNVSNNDISSLKREFNVQTPFIVSMIARFRLDKDYEMFLDVAKKVNTITNDVTFLGVGKGPLLNFYIKQAKEKDITNVRFTGFRTDIDTILAATDISILCTNCKVHAEGVSNSILESMASGVPVVATFGGGTEEIINNGIDGFIVSPSDSDKMAEIVINLLNDNVKRISIGIAAKTKIKSDFKLDEMSKKYINVYNNILKK